MKVLPDDALLTGWTEIIHCDKDGQVKAANIHRNLITSAGKAASAARLGGISMNAFDYIAVGTGTTAADAADTALESEITDTGLARAQDASPTRSTTTVTNDTLEIDYTFTATGSKAVTEAGLLNAASSGTLYSRQTFSAYNVEEDDTLKITWKILHA